jgi:hypothetical protein
MLEHFPGQCHKIIPVKCKDTGHFKTNNKQKYEKIKDYF